MRLRKDEGKPTSFPSQKAFQACLGLGACAFAAASLACIRFSIYITMGFATKIVEGIEIEKPINKIGRAHV